MGIKFTNNASSNIIHALPADATSVSITPDTGDLFPSLTEGDYFYATLAGNNGLEIVKVTNRVQDTMTIVRAQDNTTALSFDMGDLFELRIVAADFEDTFSHVETTLEDTVSNVETTLENTVDTLNSSVDNKMSSYLPLSGGTMTGPIVSTSGLALRSENLTSVVSFFGGVHSEAGAAIWLHGIDNEGGLLRLRGGGRNEWSDLVVTGSSCTFRGSPVLTSAGGTMSGLLTIENGILSESAGRYPAIRGTNNSLWFLDDGTIILRPAEIVDSSKDFRLYPNGVAHIANSPVLTAAGGTITGNLSLASAYSNRPTESVTIGIGSTWNDGPCLSFYGVNYPGMAGKFALRAGTAAAELIGDPNGGLSWGGNPVLTSAGGNVSNDLIFPTGRIGPEGSPHEFIIFANETGLPNGPCIAIRTSEHSNPDSFYIRSGYTDSTHSVMQLDKNGNFTWNNNPVLTLVASWRSGANWYRKYSDGWIEQGGQSSFSNNVDITQSLLTPFATTTYVVSIFPTDHGSQDYQVMKISSRSTSSFKWTWYGASGTMMWYACGY